MPDVLRGAQSRRWIGAASAHVAYWSLAATFLLVSVGYTYRQLGWLTRPHPALLIGIGIICTVGAVVARPNRMSVILGLSALGAVALPGITGDALTTGVNVAIPAVGIPALAIVLGSRHVPPRVWLGSALAVCLIMTWASLALPLLHRTGAAPDPFFLGNRRELGGVYQLRGLLPHPNFTGAVAAVGLILATGWLLGIRESVSRLRLALLTVAAPASCGVVLLWTGSRSAWGGAAAGLAVVLSPRLRGYVGRTKLAWSIVLPILLLAIPALIVHFRWNPAGRLFAWFYAFNEWSTHRLFGYGPEFLTREEYWSRPDYAKLAIGMAWAPTHSHNSVVHALGTAGLVGAAVTMVFLGLSLYVSASARIAHGSALAATASIIAMTLLDSMLGRTEIPTTYTPLLLLLAVAGSALSERVGAPPGSSGDGAWEPRPGAVGATGSGQYGGRTPSVDRVN